jgi:CrcB protein
VNSHSPSPTSTGWATEPPDPDIADAPPAGLPRRTRRREQLEIIAVVSAGGMIGAAARYGAGLAWPTAAGSFPWTTFGINILGCALMGVLMVVVTEAYSAHRLVRPFLGTGVLGGFTTFSTYAVDSQKLISHPAAQVALLYLAATALGALAAVWVGVTATRLVLLRERGTR